MSFHLFTPMNAPTSTFNSPTCRPGGLHHKRARRVVGVLLLAAWVCAKTASAAELTLAPLVPPSPADQPAAPWRVVGVPGDKIPLTRFSITTLDGQRVLQAQASKSYGNLVHDLPAGASVQGLRLRWRWRLDQPLPNADLRQREGDDSPLKVCVLFDMPLDRLGLIERNLFRLARAASAEKLPSATLCYVWDNQLPAGTLLHNAYTARVRLLVVSSGLPAPAQWQAHERDLTTDFLQAFGQESPTLPPALAVLIGADADNTGGQSLGYVDHLQWAP